MKRRAHQGAAASPLTRSLPTRNPTLTRAGAWRFHEAAQRRPDLVEHRLVVVGEEERALLLGLWDEAPEADAIARGEVIELGRGDGLALLVDVEMVYGTSTYC